MHERRPVASLLLPVILLLVPVGATAVAFLTSAVRRSSRRALLTRFITGLAVFGPLAVLSLLSADGRIGVYGLLVLLAVGIASIPPSLLSGRGWLIALCLMLGLQLLELRQNTATFSALTTQYTDLGRLRALVTGTQILPASTAASRPWYRDWRHAPASVDGVVELALEVRASSGQPPVTWYLNSATQSARAGLEAIEFRSPTGNARRTHASPTALGGRTFLLSGTLSGEQQRTGATAACDIVVLKVDTQPWINSCGSLTQAPGAAGAFEVRWTVPEAVTENQLRMELSAEDSGLESVVVGGLELFELSPGSKVPVSGIQPSEVVLRLDTFNREPGANTLSITGLVPGTDWQRIELAAPFSSGAHLLRATLRSPSGTELQVRNVELTGSAGWKASARPARQAAWFGHPNMAAIVAVGTLLLATRFRGGLAFTISAALAAGAAVAMSGSRNGFVLLLLALAAIVITRFRARGARRADWLLLASFAAVAAALVVGLSAMDSRIVRSTFNENSVPRTSIWAAAAEAIAERPWTGWGQAAETALNDRLESAETISHAHNLWLDFGVRYGLPGVAAGLWLAAALVWLGSRRSAYAALAITVLLLGALVDSPLHNLYAWVPIFVLAAPNPGDEPATAPLAR